MPVHLAHPSESEASLPVKIVAAQDPAGQSTLLHRLIECCAYELYKTRGAGRRPRRGRLAERRTEGALRGEPMPAWVHRAGQ